MKIAATADLHGYLPTIPADADLLLIAGDIGAYDRLELENFPRRRVPYTVDDFCNWLTHSPCPVIGIAGNHDFGFAGVLGDTLARGLPWTYLVDETTEFGGFIIHGSPWTPTYGPWAFMEDDRALYDKWALIPDDVDILITHGPPFGVMDVGHGGVAAGSRTLLHRLEQIDPVLHVFGHIHGSRGTVRNERNWITANVAYVDEEYQPVGVVTVEL